MENERPKSLESRFSLKLATIRGMSALVQTLKEQFQQDNFIVLLTPAGLIRGQLSEVAKTVYDVLKPIEQDLDRGEKGSRFAVDISCVGALRDDLVRQAETEWPSLQIIDNGSFIYMKDVVLTPIANPQVTFRFDQLIVFVDQIIGISASNRESIES